jgi:hypothetical protein
MKSGALLLLLLMACSHLAPPRATFEPPASAPSPEELIRSIPPDLFRGDLAATARESEHTVYLCFVFLKDQPEDQVPMRVALYAYARGEAPKLRFVAHTPFAEGDCRRGECRARISEMPQGFQLSRESFGADHLRADYRFRLAGQDLELIGKGFQSKNEDGESCSIFFDYTKQRILHRRGKEARPEKMLAGPAPRLVADQLRFDSDIPMPICELAPQRVYEGR